jgi:hypothetical protein
MVFNIKEELKSNRPGLSPLSLGAYAQTVNKIHAKLGLEGDITSFKFLDKYDDVVKVLADYAPTTRKNMLNAVIVALKCGDDSAACKKFGELRDGYNKDYEKEQSTGKKTVKQKKNWVEWEKFEKMIEYFTKEVRRLRLRQKAQMDDHELALFGDYVLLRLYQDYPLRNDYHDVKVVSSKAKIEDGQNYLQRHKNSMKLVLTEYKTKKAYGKKEININSKLVGLLKDYLRHNKSGWLIINEKTNQPLDSVGITRRLNRISMDRLKKKLGSNMIRHSYLSHKYADNVEEMKKDAETMGHSVETQKKYIKGDD